MGSPRLLPKQKTSLGNHNSKVYIYSLSNPTTDEPIYVGQAICPITRLGGHLANPTESLPLYILIEHLKSQLLIPKLSILEIVDKAIASKREAYWIKHYCNLYSNMCNINHNPKYKNRKDYIQTLVEYYHKNHKQEENL